MKFPLYIPHYSKLTERRRYLEPQLGAWSDDVTWVTDFDQELLSELDYLRNVRLAKDSRLTWPELSLVLKHIHAWKLIAASDTDHALIFEDDVLFAQGASLEFYKRWEEAPDDYDLVFIGSGCNLHVPKSILVKDKFFYLTDKGSKCSDSYVVSKKGSLKLLAHSPFVGRAIDWHLNEIKDYLNIYWMEPALIKQGSEAGLFESKIQKKHRKNDRVRASLLTLLRRAVREWKFLRN